MLRSPIFRRLLIAAVLPLALALGILDFYLTRRLAEKEGDAAARQLAAQGAILAGEAATALPAGLEAWVELAASRSGVHVTVFDPLGQVLTDSERGSEPSEGRAPSSEVREALAGRRGVAVRRGDGAGRSVCYVALPFTHRGKPGYVLRLATPVKSGEAAGDVRWGIIGVSLPAAAVAVALAILLAGALVRRLRRAGEIARELQDPTPSLGLAEQGGDEIGNLTRSLEGMAADLRNQADRLGRESARYEAILAGMAEGVLTVDHELRVTFCNASFARATGSRFPVTDRPAVDDLVRDPAFRDMLTRALATGETQRGRLEPPARGRASEIQAAPLGSGARRGAIAVFREIPSHDHSEQEGHDFMTDLARELYSPLTAIRGYTETLLDGAVDDKENNRKFLETIKGHAVRLTGLASDLRTLAELESDKPAPPAERIPVGGAVEAALRAVESEARRRGVSLSGARPERLYVLGQSAFLEQALVNLLRNAIRSSERDGEVRMEAVPATGGKVRLTVADAGAGIPAGDMKRVFEPFHGGKQTESQESSGPGLGLMIVKLAAEKMNGTVSVESQAGQGARFTLELPAA